MPGCGMNPDCKKNKRMGKKNCSMQENHMMPPQHMDEE
jgi:hypothetical protein